MARPKIGIFGALLALGGFLAVRYVQRSRSQGPAARELSRWEDEGGTVATPAAPAGSVTAASASPAAPDAAHGTNGSTHPNGDAGAWPFPRS
jgi:predicted lipid-binding transport protein (Tim44 family)